MNLTKRQDQIMEIIKKSIVKNGYPPTVREICSSIGVSSPATVHVHLENLEGKGFISRKSSKNRAIELLVNNEYVHKDVISVPLLGIVTAGSPIEAIENPDETFQLPSHLIPNNKEVFTLTVSGESMIEAGILDGDIVIVERTKTARNGQKVVAMTDENEVTLKTFYKEVDHFRLQPENNTLEPIILDNVYILGVVIGLYRKI